MIVIGVIINKRLEEERIHSGPAAEQRKQERERALPPKNAGSKKSRKKTEQAIKNLMNKLDASQKKSSARRPKKKPRRRQPRLRSRLAAKRRQGRQGRKGDDGKKGVAAMSVGDIDPVVTRVAKSLLD